ncbi:hypothetical protein cco115_06618 [Campylobacter coli 2692]|nr:hypothetical protein cco115_06618 [Campylobacter coli 2692]
MQKEPPKAYAQMIKDEQDQLVLSYACTSCNGF